MILPKRVLGGASVKRISLGFAIAPICAVTWVCSAARSRVAGLGARARRHERDDRVCRSGRRVAPPRPPRRHSDATRARWTVRLVVCGPRSGPAISGTNGRSAGEQQCERDRKPDDSPTLGGRPLMVGSSLPHLLRNALRATTIVTVLTISW